MCMQCVAGAGPYVVGAVAGLKLLGARSARQRRRAQDRPGEPQAAPSEPSRVGG